MKNLKTSPTEPESEERYRLLTENAGDTIWAVDLTGKLTYISPSVERLCGFTPEECLARSLDEALTPASMTIIREDTQKIIAEAISGEPLKPHHLELEFIHKNGFAVWVEVSSNAMLNAAGELVGIQGISRDISERKRAEEALRESEARYRSLFENAVEGILIVETKTRRFLRVNPAFCRMLGYSPEEISDMGVENIHPAESLDYVLDEFNAHTSGKKALAAEIPCLRKDGTILYADIAGSAVLIDGKICNVGFFTDVTERKKLNDALRKSEERFKQVTESAGEWIWEVDTDGLYTFTSPAVEKILGYKPDEIVGRMHFYDFFVPEEKEALKKIAIETFTGKRAFRGFINQNLHKNGNRVILETSGVPCLDEQGRLIGYRGADTDITERRMAEEALQKSEERYRHLVDKTDTGFVVVDDQGIVIEANEPYMRLIGAEKLEEITGHSVIEWTAPEAQESNAAAVALCARQGFIQDFETIYTHRNGSRLHININATTHETPEGKRLISLCRNITKRKQMEEALRESEMRLRTVLEAVQEGITFSDEMGHFVAYNSKMERLTGFSADEANASSDYTTLLYPDPKDREKALAGLSELATIGMSREAETIIRTKDGVQKHILVTTTLIPYKDQRMFLLCEVPDYVKLAPYFTDFLYSDPFFNNLLNIIVVFCQAH